MATKVGRRGKKSGPGVGSAVFWLLTRVVLPLAVLYGLLWWRADAAVNKLLAPLRAYVDIQRGTTVLGLNGDIGFRNLVLRPVTGSSLPAVGISADRVVVQTPGLLWLVKSSLLGVPEEIPTRLGLRLEHARVSGDAAALEAVYVGGHVFFPFDLAGCEPGMSRTIAGAMGLDRATTDFSFLMTRTGGDDLSLRFATSSDGVADVSAEVKLTLAPGSDDALRIAGAVFQQATLNLVDRGFVSARNQYCAKKQAVDPAAFLARHMAAVRTRFAAEGSVPGAALTQAYESFSREGGTLAFQFKSLRPGPLMQLQGVTLESLPLYFDATVKHNDDFIAPLTFVSAATVPADPLAEGSTAAVAAEGAAPTDTAAPPGTVPDAADPVPAEGGPVAPATPSGVQVKVGQEIPYGTLPNYVGQTVEVETTLGTVRRGELTGASSISIVIRLSAPEGGFALSLPSNTVTKVRLVAPGR